MRSALRNSALACLLAAATTAAAPPADTTNTPMPAHEAIRVPDAADARPGLLRQADDAEQAAHRYLREEAQKSAAEQAAGRAAEAAAEAAAENAYPNNLDGWIREALAVMEQHGIPGTYKGIHRNIMRESSGNPNAVNDWDINARNGVPSKGLLQVIQPTFEAYHVEGTAWSLTDPVANIAAACNYAADRYGSIDNVDSAY